MLRSPRIALHPMAAHHLPLLHGLDSDPVVMEFLLGRARTSAEIDEFWGPRCADTAADAAGLGWWVGFDGDEFLGWWMLGRNPSTAGALTGNDQAEIGWRVMRRRWRQGLATEGALLLLDHGFNTLGLQHIWAETMAVNLASRGVMRRIGMRHVRTEVREWTDSLPGADRGEVLYEITATEWKRVAEQPEPPQP
ncbi:GNAT family N-acetyltransferase [Rhodococcus ruber]|uniref:GNAT family N-acetyltransferase n=1 Tax=Rhodococcus ruber TaxID=1830 RepID=A0ABT4MIP5_9NOCA|nr:GNAT family N-acetyltransferase [Rhodococcus ruber]MCZ4520549.1 GNAT family N-acetyltransferase [Rhodococcus ruber]